MKTSLFALLFLLASFQLSAQDPCPIRIGTNLSGISDWMTEMPFVDRMHNARTWGTRNRSWIGGNATNTWNTELTHLIECDEDGYPLELPFWTDGLELEDSQMVFTVWASLDAWEPGIYTFLYDGEGSIEFGADGDIIESSPGRMLVEIIPSDHSFLELKILRSKKGNHLRNFRLIMPGHENTYQTQPFNPLYLERLGDFAALRFMDWGSTNNWGAGDAWLNYDEAADTALVPWEERSQPGYFTWAHNKGVPYEMMCQLCNTLKKDMWVCAPHNASDEYLSEMALLIQQNLHPELKVYAEYSNEIWNWMFGQTQWLNRFYCVEKDISWPEGLADRVQNHLNIWNEVFASEPERLITVAGGQTGWQDVTNRIVNNLDEGSFDALNITAYFGLGSEGDAALDALGNNATAADVAVQVRKNRREELSYLQNQFALAKQLNIPVVFYEAGQHITPHPFGEEPSYANALLELQRDTAMYNLYHEWFEAVKKLVPENQQSLYMNFSFIAGLSARYGSWGILETLDQDTATIYAPKYQATLEQIRDCSPLGHHTSVQQNEAAPFSKSIKIIKQVNGTYFILSQYPLEKLEIYHLNGQLFQTINCNKQTDFIIQTEALPRGAYVLKTNNKHDHLSTHILSE
ncbi:MAG: hypothetical protein JXR22_04130 [Prolixibacteraceae bacterium]|nr:hypothetical protein [Prolixibacteraceae bacterium]